MRKSLIVIDPPSLNQPFCLNDRSEPLDVQAFVPQCSVKGFDEGVVGTSANSIASRGSHKMERIMRIFQSDAYFVCDFVSNRILKCWIKDEEIDLKTN